MPRKPKHCSVAMTLAILAGLVLSYVACAPQHEKGSDDDATAGDDDDNNDTSPDDDDNNDDDLSPDDDNDDNDDFVWTPMTSGSDIDLASIWGASHDDVYTVGENIILHYDGKSWSAIESPGLYYGFGGVWGSAADDIYVVGSYGYPGQPVDGVIYHYNGGSWSETRNAPEEVYDCIWGAGPDDIYVGGAYWTSSGDDDNISTPEIIHFDGRGWSQVYLGTAGIGDGVSSISGIGSGDAFATEYDLSNGVLRFDGVSWSQMSTGSASLLTVWGAAANDYYATGSDQYGGTWNNVFHYNGSDWKVVYSAQQAVNFFAVGGTAANDVFALGFDYPDQIIMHYDGATWENMPCPPGLGLAALWASNRDDVLVVGLNGEILHYGSAASGG